MDLSGAKIRNANLAGLEIREAWLDGVVMRGVEIPDLDVYGELGRVVVNGVDVTAYVETELDRRYPDRSLMRPTDPEGFRVAWDVVERFWDDTVARARTLDPALLHERVDGEWSFTETLRHLVFATDCWVGRALGGDPAPWHPLALPWDGMPDTEGVPRDREARPDLDTVLAMRRDRMDQVRAVIEALTPDRLAGTTTPVEAIGWPEPRAYPVQECLRTVLNEEWEHHLYAERDLDRLSSARSPSTPA
ncbi:DinB family protein [Jatrophihabitans sp. YIM 134969]